jgi:hypothetical protein
MTSDLTNALKHLTDTFAVKDIMTGKSRLICAKDADAAPAVSASHPDFSVIPIMKDGELIAYFEREAKIVRPIEVGDLVSEGTTLLNMVDILQRRTFSFVLTDQRIGGYVHYSDLNHQMVKWTFYVMLEAVERLALENLRPGDERVYLKEKLSPERFRQIEGMYERAADNGRSLMTYLNLADILRLAVSDGTIQLNETSITFMKVVRDWAAHVLYDLSPETAVQNLAIVKGECLRLLSRAERPEGLAAFGIVRDP